MTEDEAQEHNGIEEIKREALRLEMLKKQKAQIEDEIADIEKYLDKAVETGVTFDDDDNGDAMFVTVVRGTVDRFDEFLMSSRYQALWFAVTKRVLDKEKYLDAYKSGAITPEMHAKFHHSMPKKAYVKITRHKRRGDSA